MSGSVDVEVEVPVMSFADLKAALDKLTPEQLAKPVIWVGDDRGGLIQSLGFAEEDAICDEADTGEVFARSEFEEQCADDPERLAQGRVTCKKGSPLLYTDCVSIVDGKG